MGYEMREGWMGRREAEEVPETHRKRSDPSGKEEPIEVGLPPASFERSQMANREPYAAPTLFTRERKKISVSHRSYRGW